MNGATEGRPVSVLLGLGSNLGEREQNLRKALELIANAGALTACSSLWQTAPWGYDDHRPYLNMVCQLDTRMDAFALHQFLREVELKCGRKQKTNLVEGYAARELDIDILTYGCARVNTDELIIPHPRMEKRNFVLFPLREIVPDFVHPVLGKSVAELITGSGDASEVSKLSHGL